MLHHYQQRSQSVQRFSESDYESESGSEEERGLVECGHPAFLQKSVDARQCGSAVGSASYGSPQPALDNYFAQLTEQYNRGSTLDGHAYPMSSYQSPKQWEDNGRTYAFQDGHAYPMSSYQSPKQWEDNGRTYTDHKVHYNTNKYIGYAQNSAQNYNNHGPTLSYQKDGMVPTSSKPSTPKKGKEEHGYDYYESNARKNNNGLRYTSQENFTIPQISRSKANKGKIKSVYYYEESEFDDHPRVRYGANNIPPLNSKPI